MEKLRNISELIIIIIIIIKMLLEFCFIQWHNIYAALKKIGTTGRTTQTLHGDLLRTSRLIDKHFRLYFRELILVHKLNLQYCISLFLCKQLIS